MNCNDALLLEKVPRVAREQRLAVASVRTAVKVRDEDVFINSNIVRWWDKLAGYFTYEFNCSMPPTIWRNGNIYSIVTELGDLAPGDSHPSYTAVYTIDGVHRLYRVV